MNEAASGLLKRLDEADWFGNIGKDLADPSVVHVTRWLDAIAAATDGWWETVGYQFAMALRETVGEADPIASATWETLETELGGAIRPMLARKVKSLRDERGFPLEAEMILGHQVKHAVLEVEFLALPEPGFFGSIAVWVLNGRYPCGVTSDGVLKIY